MSQVGFAVITGWDLGVVHPFASLLFSNGGSYLSDDYQTVAFGSEAGLQTLQLYQDLLDSHGMDMSIAGMTEFPERHSRHDHHGELVAGDAHGIREDRL